MACFWTDLVLVNQVCADKPPVGNCMPLDDAASGASPWVDETTYEYVESFPHTSTGEGSAGVLISNIDVPSGKVIASLRVSGSVTYLSGASPAVLGISVGLHSEEREISVGQTIEFQVESEGAFTWASGGVSIHDPEWSDEPASARIDITDTEVCYANAPIEVRTGLVKASPSGVIDQSYPKITRPDSFGDSMYVTNILEDGSALLLSSADGRGKIVVSGDEGEYGGVLLSPTGEVTWSMPFDPNLSTAWSPGLISPVPPASLKVVTQYYDSAFGDYVHTMHDVMSGATVSLSWLLDVPKPDGSSPRIALIGSDGYIYTNTQGPRAQGRFDSHTNIFYRYSEEGVRDESWGISFYSGSPSVGMSTRLLELDGELFVISKNSNSSSNVVRRLTADGSFDPSFSHPTIRAVSGNTLLQPKVWGGRIVYFGVMVGGLGGETNYGVVSFDRDANVDASRSALPIYEVGLPTTLGLRYSAGKYGTVDYGSYIGDQEADRSIYYGDFFPQLTGTTNYPLIRGNVAFKNPGPDFVLIECGGYLLPPEED